MSTSIGIAIGAATVRAVVLRGGRVVAASEAQLAAGDSLAETVAELLAAAPAPRWPRPLVTVALGPARAQVRHVSGLPPLTDPRALAGILREGSGRFFLRNGVAPVTTGVRVEGPGTVWCGALDADAVRAAEEGCRRAGFRLAAVVPAVVVLGAALTGERVLWRDGAVVAEVGFEEGRMLSVRRLAGAAALAEAPEPRPVAALALVGEQAVHFADAYGAALLERGEPLALRPGGRGSPDMRVPGWRLAVPAAVLAAALGFALVAPAWRALAAGEAASARLGALGARRGEAATARRELERVDGALAEAAAFSASRASPSLLLAEVTRALPQGSALVSLRVDSAGGSLVALAPRAAPVLSALERVPGVTAPEIVGAVTREAAAGRQVERVGIRFGLAPPVPSQGPAAGRVRP
jgi:hypothetical protein